MLLRHRLTTGLTVAAEKSPSCKTLCTRFRIYAASLFGQALSKSPRARVPSQNLPPTPGAHTRVLLSRSSTFDPCPAPAPDSTTSSSLLNTLSKHTRQGVNHVRTVHE